MNTRSPLSLAALGLTLVGLVAAGCPKEDAPKGATASSATGKKARPAIPKITLERGDLPVIKKRGTLRFLTFGALGEDRLPRQGAPSSYERKLCEAFAARLGLEAVFVHEESADDVIPALLQGKGDIIAAQLTVTEERQKKVAFTRPVKVVNEMLVGRTAMGNAPASLKDLGGRKIHVRPSSSYAETVRALAEDKAAAPVLVPEAETRNEEDIVRDVADGKIPFTIVDDDSLASLTSYIDGITGFFAVREGRQIAWAVRQEDKELKAAADGFLIGRALTGHTRAFSTDDLDGIRKRKVLRVLTRNNGVTYFLHRGVQRGFDFEIATLVAKALGVRLEVVVPPSADLLIPWLKEGRGDVIAASFTVTADREQEVAFSLPYLLVDEMLVGKSGDENAPKSLEELKGKTITVRKSSSYAQTLEQLKGQGGYTPAWAPEEDETEKLLEDVAAGTIPYTAADSHILAIEQTYDDTLQGLFALEKAPKGAVDARGKPRTEAKTIAFAVRQENKKLKAFLDGWVKKNYRGLEYNMLKNRYFKNKRRIMSAKDERLSKSGTLSPYDDVIRRYSKRYGLDWRLMAAQAFQESRFDPKAKSWVGALGLFQVMPATGKELGFTNLTNPEAGTHAGIKYMHQLIGQFEDTLPLKERIRFALASYNAGRGHVIDARRLARQLGYDGDKWFGNVEKAMLLLAQDKYARRARHGYCRGHEPVQYVSKIQSRYDAYVELAPEG